jgi:hypothetical protein
MHYPRYDNCLCETINIIIEPPSWKQDPWLLERQIHELVPETLGIILMETAPKLTVL